MRETFTAYLLAEAGASSSRSPEREERGEGNLALGKVPMYALSVGQAFRRRFACSFIRSQRFLQL